MTNMSGHQLGIVVTQFNPTITEPMLLAALDEAALLGAEIQSVLHLPGAYEVPIAVNELLKSPEITAVVVLGFIEKGETQHGEVMAHVVTQAVLNSSLNHGKAIGYGIIGPGALVTQAEVRKDPYARAAVRAAIASTDALRSLKR
jgi:6,7-dimethyl-8-ribityllumazine synthase